MATKKILYGCTQELSDMIPSMVEIASAVFREYPFKIEYDIPAEIEHMSRCMHDERSLAVLLYEKKVLIGFCTGFPLERENQSLKSTLEEKGQDVSTYYCFGDVAVYKQYRGYGFGSFSIKVGEEHAKKHHFKKACIYTKKPILNDPEKPHNYKSLNKYWGKMGYEEKKDWIGYLMYKKIGEKEPAKYDLEFWTKDIAD
jgi:GNAT superfamily N-acetyltransferase